MEAFGGGSTFGPAVEWNQLLPPLALEKLAAGGISEADLEVINNEFEAFWNIGLGKMTRVDSIDAETGAAETADLSRAYFVAFDQIRPNLKAAWRLNQFSAHNHPGWDLSPFGYVTKTIRDKEFFSGGDVPGECILEAAVVDRTGRKVDVLANPRATGTSGATSAAV